MKKEVSERKQKILQAVVDEYITTAELSDVETAQQNIVKIVRRLEAENKVVVSRGAGEVFV